RCAHRLAINHVGSLKDGKDIVRLGLVKTIRCLRDLDAKEVMNLTQVLNREFRAQKLNE
ncbi:hypothetical protein ACLOJK_020294, partial [Asimina triloba]